MSGFESRGPRYDIIIMALSIMAGATDFEFEDDSLILSATALIIGGSLWEKYG